MDKYHSYLAEGDICGFKGDFVLVDKIYDNHDKLYLSFRIFKNGDLLRFHSVKHSKPASIKIYESNKIAFQYFNEELGTGDRYHAHRINTVDISFILRYIYRVKYSGEIASDNYKTVSKNQCLNNSKLRAVLSSVNKDGKEFYFIAHPAYIRRIVKNEKDE